MNFLGGISSVSSIVDAESISVKAKLHGDGRHRARKQNVVLHRARLGKSNHLLGVITYHMTMAQQFLIPIHILYI